LLYHAIQADQLDAVKVLLEHGQDFRATDQLPGYAEGDEQSTFLDLAQEIGDQDIVDCLLKAAHVVD